MLPGIDIVGEVRISRPFYSRRLGNEPLHGNAHLGALYGFSSVIDNQVLNLRRFILVIDPLRIFKTHKSVSSHIIR